MSRRGGVTGALVALLTAGCLGGSETTTYEPSDTQDLAKPDDSPPDTSKHYDMTARDFGRDAPDATRLEEMSEEVDLAACVAETQRCEPGGCVDLLTDARHCGQCGRRCIFSHGEAACVGGECVLQACEEGYFDRDGALENGCEQRDACTPPHVCMSACGTEGMSACEQGEEVCVAPAEVCNAVDDDCDGECDEGALAGCRVAIHRGTGAGHIYSNDQGMLPTVESLSYFYLYPSQPQGESGGGFRPVFLCRKGDGTYLLSSDLACEGNQVHHQLGFWASQQTCGATPLYRLHNATHNDHFYTVSAPERDNAVSMYGYRDEGVAGYVWRAP